MPWTDGRSCGYTTVDFVDQLMLKKKVVMEMPNQSGSQQGSNPPWWAFIVVGLLLAFFAVGYFVL